MAWHLVPEITRHLTKTETCWLLSESFTLATINPSELDLTLSIWRYGLTQTPAIFNRFDALTHTVSYDVFTSHLITRQIQTLTSHYQHWLVERLTTLQRPIMFLEHVVVNSTPQKLNLNAGVYCNIAARTSNRPILQWIPDPNRINNVCPWDKWTHHALTLFYDCLLLCQ